MGVDALQAELAGKDPFATRLTFTTGVPDAG
jgi:hypothetical protein